MNAIRRQKISVSLHDNGAITEKYSKKVSDFHNSSIRTFLLKLCKNEKAAFKNRYRDINGNKIIGALKEMKGTIVNQVNDGFTNPWKLDGYHYSFFDANNSNLNFLHLNGAFHIFENVNLHGKQTIKIRNMWLESDYINAITNLMNKPDWIPTAIATDNSAIKKHKIKNSKYSKFCHEQLGKISGQVYLIGLDFHSDEYVIEILNNRRVSKITWVYCEEKLNSKSEIEKLFNPTKIEFIDIKKLLQKYK